MMKKNELNLKKISCCFSHSKVTMAIFGFFWATNWADFWNYSFILLSEKQKN